MPSPASSYEILRSCTAELQDRGIVADRTPLLPFGAAEALGLACDGEALGMGGLRRGGEDGMDSEAASCPGGGNSMEEDAEQAASRYLSGCLLQVARQTDGLSGRTLRKLPFLAHAAADWPDGRASGLQFMSALLTAARQEKEERGTLTAG